jgi:hypothetical protein
VKAKLVYDKLHFHLNMILKWHHWFDHVMATHRNHSQIQNEHCSEQGLFQNVDSFIVFHLVGVVIQAREILFCLVNLVNMLEHERELICQLRLYCK